MHYQTRLIKSKAKIEMNNEAENTKLYELYEVTILFCMYVYVYCKFFNVTIYNDTYKDCGGAAYHEYYCYGVSCVEYFNRNEKAKLS